MQGLGNEHPSKAEWRTRLTRARGAVSPEQHAADAAALAETAATLARGTVCAYLPFGTEPGSVALLDALLAGGARVLLPIVPPTPGPLEWAEYTGEDALVNGHFRGVREPSGPKLGAHAVGEAGLVLVPALGVDRRGVRLGRGAGFYDRSLVFAPDADLLAVVRDEELVDLLPGQDHDIRMRGALTPGRGVVRFTEL
ncbi:5-formyltetrahydrofolate cyclo-ligase [Amycolatopsis sp. NPDC059027]|uniref:5-formyltetrahydrofolate cyclo-ligase n=1 Tax=unclassified Amycolatopsis TaxID=2618356 RepID=UPI00366B4356